MNPPSVLSVCLKPAAACTLLHLLMVAWLSLSSVCNCVPLVCAGSQKPFNCWFSCMWRGTTCCGRSLRCVSLLDLVCVDGDAYTELASPHQEFVLPAFYCFIVTVLYVLAGLNMAGNQCQGCSTEIQGYWPNICRVHTKVGDIRM